MENRLGTVNDLPPTLREVARSLALRRLAELKRERSRYDWRAIGREAQLAPDGEWRYWCYIGGRGAGKTRAGAEWIRERVEAGTARRIALVAPTASDARDVMVEGESGILAISRPDFCPIYEPSKRRLTWPNGAMATTFSADEPERLRGPQHDTVWGDEIAAWQYLDRAFMLLDHGLRLKPHPCGLFTTTPKPVPLLWKLLARSDVTVTRSTSYENRDNLAPDFIRALEGYEGTTLGRQEIHGELINPSESAILKRPWWRLWWEDKPPHCERIILSLDTAFKDTEESDYSALTVWGLWRTEEGTANLILLSAWREKLLYPDLKARMIQEVRTWTYDEPPVVIIEDKASGPSLMQELSRAGINAWPYNPGREPKDLRAHLVSDLLHQGRIWAPGERLDNGTRSRSEFTLQAEMVISDCEVFPAGEHDDLVDTCVQAWSYLRGIGAFRLPSDPMPERPRHRPMRYYGMATT